MKIKHLIPIFILLAIGTFSSCNLFDKAGDITFQAELPLPFNVNETADNPSGKTYTDSKLLDASSNPDVAKYASKIKEFKVNKITYTISGVSDGSVTFTNGTLKVASSGKTIASASSVNLGSSAETELTADANGFNELASLLLADKQELVQVQGSLSKTPVAFTVNFKFFVTITANAL
ncbi:MAG: hypothetical protein JNM78_16170 [Cyclobacteriaceae bacterium]|nr:hypothetical protein [Cyclobacteriaceae bacterium]